MQERRGEPLRPRLVVEPLIRGELVAARVDAMLKRLHDVCGADRMRKARVLCSGEHEGGKPKLPNAT